MTEMDWTRWLKDGTEVVLRNKLDDGYLVEIVRDYWDGYESYPEPSGELEVVSEIFEKPPTRHVEETIAALEERKHGLYEDIRALETAKRKKKEEYQAQLERLSKRHAALRYIEQFLDGEVTHFVVNRYSHYEILTTDELVKSDSRYQREQFKLLSLYGQTDGDLQWRLNKYSDGSGGTTWVYPCMSYAEAQEKLRELFLAKITRDDHRPSVRDVGVANAYDIELPNGFAKEAYMRAIEGRAKMLTKAQERVAELKNTLLQYQNRLSEYEGEET